MIGVGIAGFGMATQVFHRPLIESVEGLTIVGALRNTRGDAGGLPQFTDLSEFLKITEMNVVVVATPNESHFQVARASLEKGFHVVVDKPLSVTTREGEELIQIARQRRRLLTVFHNRRFDGDFLVLQKLLREGTLGRIVSVESAFDRFRPALKANAWREAAQAGAGVFYDLGPHLIDQALELFGKPQAVFAQVRAEREGARVDDAFDVTLMFDELTVTLRTSMLAAVPRPRFHLRGTKGSYVKYDVDEQERLLKEGVRPLDPNWNKAENQPGSLVLNGPGGVVTTPVPTPLGDYRSFYVNLRDAVGGKVELAVPAEAGVETVRIIEAAMESSRAGRVIKL